MMIRNILYIAVVLFAVSCNHNAAQEPEKETLSETTINNEEDNHNIPIIAERIDGPANIRDKPNGEIIFTLDDNTLVEVTQEKDGWFELLVYADIELKEFGMDTIKKGRSVIIDGESIGRIMKTFPVSTQRGQGKASVMLHGYTHKNNIKPETVIETRLLENLKNNNRNISSWLEFINLFVLDTNAVDFNGYKTFYNYENTLGDPSPGFRIVLLFENDKLVGFIHSRELELKSMKTYKLKWSYRISFFSDYPQAKQQSFVDYMNKWIQEVD